MSLPSLTDSEIRSLVSSCAGDICIIGQVTDVWLGMENFVGNYNERNPIETNEPIDVTVKYHISINTETGDFGLNTIDKKYNQDLIFEDYFWYLRYDDPKAMLESIE